MEFKTPIKNAGNTNKKLMIPASPFLKKIGYGTGVAVYEFQRSPLRDKLQSPWAVKKMIKKCKQNTEIEQRLKDEAEILRRLEHPNIVGFRAFIEKENVLAMEECTNCLGEAIEERFDVTNEPFPVTKIIKVANDIAQALKYLHDVVNILHFDIKSFNILIKGDFKICKLCDFGVCLPLDSAGNMKTEAMNNHDEMDAYMGTEMWCAPEVLNYPQTITSKADIYAYGLVIWEMLALMPPDFRESNDMSEVSFNLSDNRDENGTLGIIRKRPDLPQDVELGSEYNTVLELFFICTEEKMEKRPTASNLCDILSSI